MSTPDPAADRQVFQAIFLTSLDAIMVTTPGGDILAANPAACRILGRDEQEICRIGRAGIVDESDPRLVLALEARGATGQFQGELSFLRATGEPFPVEVATSVFTDVQGHRRTTMIFRDITERQRTEAALRSSEEKFAKAFHTSPDGITLSRLSDGRFFEVNEGYTAMTGYLPEEVVGRTSLELGIWLDLGQRENFVRTLATHGEVINLEVDFRFKGGVIKTTLVSARLVEIAGETIILSTTRDISELKVAQEQWAQERKRLADSLMQTQKLEALGLLAGGIAHDFNNMLGGIFGFVELARDQLTRGNTEKTPFYLEKALGIHGRARSLTQQLLTFAKGGAPLTKTLRLEPLLRHNVAFALSGSNVTCNFDFDQNLWPCEGDENQLGQVIDNLLLNAKQSMPAGGTVLVQARNRQDPQGHAGAFVQVLVADRGPGILPENLPKIFDPFFSTKPTGHGLGLPTVFSIVNRHLGWVEVESVPGEGATFHVFLPASTKPPLEDEAGVPMLHRGTGPVLVLDDEDFLREVASEMLESLGYRVVTCRQGSEAVRLYTQALQTGEPFTAALLDLTIPGDQGGAEAARNIRLVDPSAILIAASGYSDDPILHRPDEYGFSGRIAKPYLRADLSELLSRILG